MPRRYRDPFHGARFAGDRSKMLIHDLDNEVRGEGKCEIGAIERDDGCAFETAAAARTALGAGFAPCPHCLGANAPDDSRPGRYSSLGARPLLP